MNTVGPGVGTGIAVIAGAVGTAAAADRVGHAMATSDHYMPAPAERDSVATLASARQGILKHGEHLADLVLDIVPGAESGAFPGFELYASFIRRFMVQIEAREISVLNEKFDGSPAIVLGFDAKDRPFVAYKLGIEREGAPRIIRTVKEASSVYRAGAMKEIFEDVIRHLRPRLAKFSDKDLVFQADLLFTPRNGTKTVSDDAVSIKANPFGITYTLPAGSKFYPFARDAEVGLVVHTVGRRVIDPANGEIAGVQPADDAECIERFVKALRSEDVFAIDPWSRRVRINQGDGVSFTAEKEAEISTLLKGMREGLGSVGSEFRLAWKPFLPLFRTFLNSSLKEGRSGGIYRAAAAGEIFDFDLIVERFRVWLYARSNELRINPKGVKRWMAPRKMPDEYEKLLAEHSDPFRAYLKAYFDANRVQYLLKPHMSEVYASKLGGGRIEGIMITDAVTQVKVKLVDRLDFTKANFAGEAERKRKKRVRRGKREQAAPKKKPSNASPSFLRRWRPGAAFFIGKLQPPHAGHIALIGAVMREFSPEEIFVLASDKAPDFEAKHWADFGVAQRKKDLVAREFEHAFSRVLREDMLRYGVSEGVSVGFADPIAFWRYLGKARATGRRGSVHLIVGAKEMAAGRYDQQLERYSDQLRLWPVEMQSGGMSATEVRRAVKLLHERGDFGAYEFLVRALEFIPKKERDGIIGRLVKEWGDVEAAAARLL
jgi:hypothetical protein